MEDGAGERGGEVVEGEGEDAEDGFRFGSWSLLVSMMLTMGVWFSRPE